MKDLINKTLFELSVGIQEKDWTSFEVCKTFLDRAKKYNESLNAFITFNDKLLDEARECDKDLAGGKDLSNKPLFGIPIGFKDMFCTEGIRTTAASKILENFIPPYSATVVKNLQNKGALIFGKCNQDEFAMGSSTETSFFGPTKNPWNKSYVPGGSSGGSAAAVAARMIPAALGTDTGGSIRQPAHFCGLVGVKPTYGRVSRYGVIAFASSLDQAGPLTHNIKDASLVLDAMCGSDKKDSTTAKKAPTSFTKNLNANIKGFRVGVPKEYLPDTLCKSVRESIDKSLSIIKELGGEIIPVSLEYLNLAVPTYYLVATSEASSNLARYDGVRFGYRSDFQKDPAKDLHDFYSRTRGEGFGSEVKRRILLGTFSLSSGYYDAYYKKACQTRRLIQESFKKAFEACDVLLGPVSSNPAFKLQERVDDPVAMYMNDIFTVSSNLAGIPSMSVPAGFNEEGLPVGVQVLADHFEEQKMLNLSLALEQSFKLDRRTNDIL